MPDLLPIDTPHPLEGIDDPVSGTEETVHPLEGLDDDEQIVEGDSGEIATPVPYSVDFQSLEGKVSWWGFDAEDSTEYLQAAINSGVNKITLDEQDGEWISETLILVGDQEIYFEDGVELQAKVGSLTGRNDVLVKWYNVNNVTMRGNGTIRMQKADYEDPAQYVSSQYRHALSIRSSNNATVDGLTILETGGDGIYYGRFGINPTNTDGEIKNVTCQLCRRNALSIISADTLLVEDCDFEYTTGSAPQSGVDIEPNSATDQITDVTLRRVNSKYNTTTGFEINLSKLTTESEDVSLVFDTCVADSNLLPLRIRTLNDNGVSGSISFADCDFLNSSHSGVTFWGIPFVRLPITMTDCTIDNVGYAHPTEGEVSPIRFTVRDGDDGIPMGSVTFTDVYVKIPFSADPISTDGDVGDLSGNLWVWDGSQYVDTELTTSQLEAWLGTSYYSVGYLLMEDDDQLLLETEDGLQREWGIPT